MPGLLRPTREGVLGEAPFAIREGACGLRKWCKLLVLKLIGLPRKPSYSVSFLHRIFLLSSPHTIILDMTFGGFPDVVKEGDEKSKLNLLKTYRETIFYRDVVERFKIK